MGNSKLWLVSAGLVGALSGMTSSAAMASTIYLYTGTSPVSSLSFTTSLTGAAVNNLAPGTDITATVSAFTINASFANQDMAGFPLGGGLGSGYESISAQSVKIGTDALGNITSFNIIEDLFASYPAFSGENPNDFYCRYHVSTTTTTSSATLTVDNDAGFCPASVSAKAGTFAAIATAPPTGVPEPASAVLFGSELIGLMGLAAVRRRHADAR